MKRLSTVVIVLSTVLTSLGQLPRAEEPTGYHLVNNFSGPMPGNAVLRPSVDTNGTKVGAASGRIDYHFSTNGLAYTTVQFAPGRYRSKTGGTLKLWVKGDDSGNRLTFNFHHSAYSAQTDQLTGHQAIPSPPTVTLNFNDWREVEFPLKSQAGNRILWWHSLRIDRVSKEIYAGKVWLDDMRVIPPAGRPLALAQLNLLGEHQRDWSPTLAFNLDVRNFSEEPFTLESIISVVDHEDKVVVRERRSELKLQGGEMKEKRLDDLRPDNGRLENFQPPFRVTLELVSNERPELASRREEKLVMANSVFLLDDFSNVHGTWFTSGLPFNLTDRGQMTGIFGEPQRAHPGPQLAARISRVPVASEKDRPVTPYAMQIDYRDDTMIHRRLRRELPGAPFAVGSWVKGDGQGGELWAVIIDFSAPGSNFYNWKRTLGKVKLCDLNFTGWKYVEKPVLGGGLGKKTIRGSTDGIDYPLEFVSLAIVSPRLSVPQANTGVAIPLPATGQVQISGLKVKTQQSKSQALSIHAGYDDPHHVFDAKHSATITVQNSWAPAARDLVRLKWRLTDRDDELIATDTEDFNLNPTDLKTFRLSLGSHASKAASHNGPFHLRITVEDRKGKGAAETTLVLAKPDSAVTLTGFESARPKFGFPPDDVYRAMGYEKGTQVLGALKIATAEATTAQKHSGTRALAMKWTKGQPVMVSLDPLLPGVPTEVSLWVFGDKSNVILYPLLGDQNGVISDKFPFDLFLPLTNEGELQNVVRVDWAGWKQVRFRLPVIPATWNDTKANHGFVPTYPLGLHLAVAADRKAAADTLAVNRANAFVAAARKALATANTKKTATDKTMASVKAALMKQTMALQAAEKAAVDAATVAKAALAKTAAATTTLAAAEKDVMAKAMALQKLIKTDGPMKRKPAMDKLAIVAKTLLDASRSHADTSRVLVAIDAAVVQATKLQTDISIAAKAIEAAVTKASAETKAAATAFTTVDKDAVAKKTAADTALTGLNALITTKQKPSMVAVTEAKAKLTTATRSKTTADTTFNRARTAKGNAQIDQRTTDTIAKAAEAKAKAAAGDPKKTAAQKTAAMNLAIAKRKLADAAATRFTTATTVETSTKTAATTAGTALTAAQAALTSAEQTLMTVNMMVSKAKADSAAADKLRKDADTAARAAKTAADRAAATQSRLEAAAKASRASESTAKKNVDQLMTVTRKDAMTKATAAATTKTTAATAKAAADKVLEAINKEIATATATAITTRKTAESVVKKAQDDLAKAKLDQAKAEQLAADKKEAAVGVKEALEAFKKDETSGAGVLTAATKAVTTATQAQTVAQAQLTAAQAQKAKKEEGLIYIDDVQVITHLPLAERISVSMEREGDSNVLQPGKPVRVRVANAGRVGAVAVTVSGGLYNWRDQRVSGEDKSLSLAPGQAQSIDFAAKVLPGAYRLQVDLKNGDKILRTLSEEFLVLDATTVLGAQWQTDLGSTDKLRHPIGGAFTLIRHDWDWMEFQPGNLQVHTLLNFAYQVRAQGHAPQVILGYSPYWASGSGHKAMLKNELSPRGGYDRGGRDWGHAVDIFHAPRRMDDWDNYTREVMRKAGRHMEGFVVWDSPDSPPTKMGLGIKPENFSRMLELSDHWRKRFCPQTPIIIGGLSRKTAIGYLTELEKHDSLKYVDGVNLRLDAGRSTPEDARIRDYLEDVRGLLNKPTDANATAPARHKNILVTDLDWAVEKAGRGALDGFDQAAHLARARLLLHSMGVEHALTVANKDAKRIGFGLAYREPRSIPPLEVSPAAHRLKPGWLAMVRTGNLLGQLRFEAEVIVPDRSPGRTWCFKYVSEADGAPVIILWRNHHAGAVNFAGTGFTVAKAEDLFGTPATAEAGWWPIGKMPVAFTLKPGGHKALGRLWVRDTDSEPHWTQRALATFTPATGTSYRHEIVGAQEANFTGRDFSGRQQTLRGSLIDNNGTERFVLPAPQNAGILLRKQFYLGKTGQKAEVWINGKSIGAWDFRRKIDDSKLSEGIREAAFLIPPSALTGTNIANVELRYEGPANTLGWTALEYNGAPAPLQSLGALHVDSPVVPPRRARNVVGQPLRIGETEYTEGISAFAPALLDYPLNGQFEKFTAQVGIDAATEGKGSVAFEVYADGKQVWTSGQMTGLDKPKDVDVPVKGVKRLRLVVTNGGDGKDFDVADWANARLHTAPAAWQGVKFSAAPPATVIAAAKTTKQPTVVSSPTTAVTTLKPRHTGTRMLASKDLVVEVMDPAAANGYYTGVRFTPLAAVLRAVKGGKEYLFNPVTHNKTSDHAGLASEFDLITPGGPPGFAEAAANGGFLKVGVGVLTKSTDQYQFWNNYPAKTLAKTIAQWSTNSVTFRQSIAPTGGYGYLLTAKVTLDTNQLHIDWMLKNTGFKPLKTRQYTHNFFRFSEKNVGPGYVISFPYTPQPGGLTDGQRHTGREIHFTKAMANALNSTVPWPTGFTGQNAVTVRHTATGQAIECITSIPGVNTSIHATEKHVCPEQFVEIALPPSKAKQWRRSYIFK